MKHFDDLESQLRKKLPPMRSSFKVDLRAKLYQNAEQQFNSSSRWASVLSFLFLFMKRYSIPAIGLATIMVVAISNILPPSISPLSPEEVLARVEENFQEKSQESQIVHEKILREDFQNGSHYFSEILETYLDTQKDSRLFLERNANDESLKYVMMNYTDDNGDGFFGSVRYNDGPADFDYNPPTFNQSQKYWVETFRGEKNYCYQRFETDGYFADINLVMAAEDSSVFQLKGQVYSKEKMAAFKNMDPFYVDLTADQVVESLVQGSDYDYELIELDGETYHLFKVSEYFDFAPSPYTYYYYVDTDTLQLKRQEDYSPLNQLIYRTTWLDREVIDRSQEKTIFDPAQFEGLDVLDFWGNEVPHHFPHPGCYDNAGQFLSGAISEYVSEPALADLRLAEDVSKHLIESGEVDVKGRARLCLKNCDGPEEDPFSSSDSEDWLPFEKFDVPEEVIIAWEDLPIRGAPVLLDFEGNENRWVFVAEEEVNDVVYAPFDGMVTELIPSSEGGSNLKRVILSHEVNSERFETSYSFLETDLSVGDKVDLGEVIGKAVHVDSFFGNWGGGIGMLFEILVDDRLVNPYLFLDKLLSY